MDPQKLLGYKNWDTRIGSPCSQVSSLCNTTQVLDLPTLGTQIYQNPCLANYFAALYKIVTLVMIEREMQNVKGNHVIILLSLNISKSITVFCLLDNP